MTPLGWLGRKTSTQTNELQNHTNFYFFWSSAAKRMGDYRNGLRLSVRPSVLPLHFLVRSISPEPFTRFSLNCGQMFASMSRCAEPISQPCQLKVKVTGQGHGFVSWISCPLHISCTPRRIFFKLWSYVCLSEMMCRTHDTRSRSQVWALNFMSALYLLYQWKDFL